MNNVVVHKQFTTNRHDVYSATSDGDSIIELLEVLEIPESLFPCLHVYVGDVYVQQEMYKFVKPKKCGNVRIIIVPNGDDMLPIIAMIAIAVAAPYMAAGMGMTGFGAAALTVGITIVGSLFINAFFPPPEADEMGDGADGSPALTIAGSRNSFPYDKPIQRIYGTVKNYPPHGAQPYTVSEGGIQYLYMLFDLGYGPIDVSELKIGETDIADYDEVDYNIVETVTSVSDLEFFTGDIDTEAVNVVLEDGNVETSRATSNEFKYAQFDLFFGGGLYGLSSTATVISETVTFQVTVKDDLGVLIPDANITVIAINPPTDVTITQTTTTDFKIGAAREDGFSITMEVRVAIGTVPDFITIEVYRASTTQNGTSTIDNCSYASLRTFRLGNALKPFRLVNAIGPVYATHTMIEMKIRATEQLNGVVDNFNCMAAAKLRKYNGSSFDAPVVTDNPAWIYADILTGTMNQRPKSDARLDWDELKRWADFCDTLAESEGGAQSKAHTCNFVLDYNATLYKLLGDVTAVGRASPDVYDDMYSVIFDEPKFTKIQLFTNMNTSEFSSSRLYTEIPDAIRVSFRDPSSDWQMREYIVYNDGFDIDSAKVFEDIKAPMLTSSDEAYRNGRYWLKQAALRKESITFKTDLEWLECKRGSFVGMQMDVIKSGGSVARVKSVIGDTITVDSSPSLNGNEVSYFELRKSNGDIVSGPVAVYQAQTPLEVDIGIPDASVGDMIVFNSASRETYSLLVKQIDVNRDQSATITCMEYVPALYDLASDAIPVYDPSIKNISSPNDVPNKLASLDISENLVLIDRKPYVSLTLTYQPDTGIIPTAYRIFKYDTDNSEWVLQGTTIKLSYSWGDSVIATDIAIIGTEHCFAVVGVSNNGQYLEPAVGRQKCITPVGDDTIPPAPDYFVVEDTAENFRRFWWKYNQVIEPDDLAGFIIKYTRSSLEDWGSASPLHDGVLINPPLEIRALPSGVQKVMLRAVDTTGNISDSPAIINFNMGDRAVENVLFEKDFVSPNPWEGSLVSGSIDAGQILLDILSADLTTSDLMWNISDTVLMWNDNSKLMWESTQGSFEWAEEVIVPVGGITTLNWAGNGEVRLSYAFDDYLDAFGDENNIQDKDEIESFENMILGGTLTLVEGELNSFGTFDATIITDTTPAAASTKYSRYFHVLGDSTKYFTSVEIKKTDAPTVIFPMLGLGFNINGDNLTYFMGIDPYTGAVDVSRCKNNTTTDALTVDDYGIIDKGTYWEAWMIADSISDTAGRFIYAYVYPAYSQTIDGIKYNDATGYGQTFFGMNLKNIDYYEAYTPLSSLVYSGSGQGLIQYTSPIILLAGTYTLIIDSPVSIDVNTLTELEWITDVPDKNEQFDDLVVPIGGLTIDLSKTYEKITVVNITLQEDAGNETKVVKIVSKDSVSIPNTVTIECFKTNGETSTTGLVDVRVQGY